MSTWGYLNSLGDASLLASLMNSPGLAGDFAVRATAQAEFFGSASPYQQSGSSGDVVALTEASTIVGGLGIGVAAVVQRIFNTLPTTGTQNTAPITTEASGSTFLLAAARGIWANGSPTLPFDSKGNSYAALLGSPNIYNGFPASENGIWAALGGASTGGANHFASLAWGLSSAGNGDEVTVALVEVPSTNTIQDASWIDDTATATNLTSGNVTTTGPATLVAFVWGYGGTGVSHVYGNTSGFTLLSTATADGDPDPAGYIQLSTFYKIVTSAGTYSITVQGTGGEAAQIYLVALQQAATGITGTGAMTQASDTNISTATHPVIGSGTNTQASDTNISTATHPVIGSGTNTQASDANVSTSTHPVTGTSARTQASDANVSTATHPVTGTGTNTQASDANASTVTHPVVANASLTQASDVVVSTGGAPAITASAVITQASDATVLTATHPVTGTSTRTQAFDAVTSAATHPVVGVGTSIQVSDANVSTATHPVTGTSTRTQASDATVAATTHPINGSASTVQTSDATSASATHPVVANYALTQSSDLLVSTVSTATLGEIFGTATIVQQSDRVRINDYFVHEDDPRTCYINYVNGVTYIEQRPHRGLIANSSNTTAKTGE